MSVLHWPLPSDRNYDIIKILERERNLFTVTVVTLKYFTGGRYQPFFFLWRCKGLLTYACCKSLLFPVDVQYSTRLKRSVTWLCFKT